MPQYQLYEAQGKIGDVHLNGMSFWTDTTNLYMRNSGDFCLLSPVLITYQKCLSIYYEQRVGID